jgi:hypothetical protein
MKQNFPSYVFWRLIYNETVFIFKISKNLDMFLMTLTIFNSKYKILFSILFSLFFDVSVVRLSKKDVVIVRFADMKWIKNSNIKNNDENKTLIVQVDLSHCYSLYIILLFSMLTIQQMNSSYWEYKEYFCCHHRRKRSRQTTLLMVNISDKFDYLYYN